MELWKQDLVIQKITAAVFVPSGSGAPVHKNRSSYGLAFNVDHDTTYRFSDGTVLTCHGGECIYLPLGASYTVDRSMPREGTDAGVYAINFLLAEPLSAVPYVQPIRGRGELLSAFTKAESAWRQKAPGYREECFSCLYRILWLLKRENAAHARSDKGLEKLVPALEYINAHYTAESIGISKLAALCGISEPYLRRLFQEVFSVSPAVYVRQLRIAYARELLYSGECSVTDAAMLSGFNDIAYFSREFKRATGVAPVHYHK